ncbi:Sulfate permease [hydrothermal vent metagenome]|uniref:Sulfate permease n=1 Tax=hydrothermal vent metagenome TaxID=652676 RepID=A0A3B0ZMJ9_9ZZZZ
MAEEAKRRARYGGAMYIINIKKGLWDALEKYGCLDEIGENRVFQGEAVAIRAIYQKLDKSICAGCSKRIFKECQTEFGRSKSQPLGQP